MENGISAGDAEAALINQIEVYHEVESDALSRYIRYLNGSANKQWMQKNSIS
jgi:hypothetical protein